MPSKPYTFRIGYMSEVNAIVTIEEDDGAYELRATHPMDNVGISDWFHFGGSPPESDPLVVTDESLIVAVADMAEALSRGAYALHREYADNPKEQFFTEFFIALCQGYNFPKRTHPSHDVGRWLMDQRT